MMNDISWTDVDTKNFSEFDNHKLVKRFEDKESGLVGFVAIHNDNLGPAVGGTRMLNYKNENDAISDVLRLSRAMTYKCALAGVKFGGGKSVIINDPKNKNKKLLKSYAEKINDLKGIFHTGEDVGISEEDVQFMLETSPYFIGKKGLAGDPSLFSALSVFNTMHTALSELFGSDDISNKIVAIKGLGKVGGELLRLVLESGAKAIVADKNESVVKNIKERFPSVDIADPGVIHSLEVDIFSPCALGNDLNYETVKEIKCKIICGGANNQILSKDLESLIFQKGIVYVPDYLANAGGLIDVVGELEKEGYSRERVTEKIENLKNVLKKIFLLSKQKKQSPGQIADKLAEDTFNGKSDL